MTNWRRVSFNVIVGSDADKAIDKVPKGLRSMIIRSLLEKIVSTANEKGSPVYGMVIDGSFDILYRKRRGQKGKELDSGFLLEKMLGTAALSGSEREELKTVTLRKKE